MSLKVRESVGFEEVDKDDSKPASYLSVSLGAKVREELEAWLKSHWLKIESDMQPVFDRLEEERNQFEGRVSAGDYPYPGAFRVNYPVTKKKVREVVNKAKQAYLDADPMFSVTIKKPDPIELAQKVESALDEAMDNEVEAEDDLSQALFESGLHGAGFLIPGWDYQEEEVREVERYEGFDGATAESLRDVELFEIRYPDWADEPDVKAIHDRILQGETLEVEASYTVPTRNCPNLEFVEASSVRVYPQVNGFSGLRKTPVYGYVKQFTRDELEGLAEAGFVDDDQLGRVFPPEPSTDAEKSESAEKDMEPYDILICTLRRKLTGDSNEVRYKAWIERKSGAVIRLRSFPWWRNQPDLIPIYAREEEPGFWKRGFAFDLKDDHIVLIVLLNLFLNAADMLNSMRFKVKHQSLAEQYLLSRSWSPHLPVPWEKSADEIEPMQSTSNHLGPIVQAWQIMRLVSDENTGTSAGTSGQESPTDPNAPASKTLLLLQQVEPNIKEVVRSMEKGVREAGRWVLSLYHQGTSLGWIDAMPGAPEVQASMLKEFSEGLNARALLFESDRQGRFDRNLMVYKILREDYSLSRPDIVARARKVLVSQVDSQWSRISDELGLGDAVVPPPMPEQPPGKGPAKKEGGGKPGGFMNGSGSAASFLQQSLKKAGALR